MNYGVPIDLNNFKEVVEPSFIYKAFDDYFEHPILTKVKDIDIYSMYMTKLYCLLNKECRCIIIFVNKDNNPPEHNDNLINLNWISFQTRTLPSDEYHSFKFKNHSYIPKSKGTLLATIKSKDIIQEASIYDCEELKLTVTLLHTEKNTKDVYQNKGTIIASLETFQTIITFQSNI